MPTHDNLVAIVTGAARGIGRATAEALAREGARVVVADKDAEAGRAAVAEIAAEIAAVTEHGAGRDAGTGGQPAGETGGRGTGGSGSAGDNLVVFIQADVRVPAAVAALVRETRDRFGRLDVLVNNAGIGRGASPYELSLDAWDEVIETNLRGSFLCAREAAAVMRENGGGAVVSIASTRALMSEPNTEAYSASKGGIVAISHALAASLAPDRIRVNCVSPGWIETRDNEALTEADHEQHWSGRVGRPEDIARAVLYLTAPGNEFVTGANLVVDGGMTRKMIYVE